MTHAPETANRHHKSTPFYVHVAIIVNIIYVYFYFICIWQFQSDNLCWMNDRPMLAACTVSGESRVFNAMEEQENYRVGQK